MCSHYQTLRDRAKFEKEFRVKLPPYVGVYDVWPTINADEHPLMRNFHKPGDEKRMVVILPDGCHDDWLTAPAERSMDFMRQFPAERMTAST